MKYIGIPNKKMPECCEACFAYTDQCNVDCGGLCRVLNDYLPYNFHPWSQKWKNCPLFEIDDSPVIKASLIDRG